MKYNEMSTDDVVKYINDQLKENRTMKDIEEKDFGEHKGVIQKRLNRKGYIKINNQFVAAKENNTNKNTKIIHDRGINNTKNTTNMIQLKEKDNTKNTTKIIQGKSCNEEHKKIFSNDEIEKLDQLLKLDLNTLKKMIDEYTTNKNTRSSIKIMDATTKVTSVRVNIELYSKIKTYAEKNNIKLIDIFNDMMLDYLNKI